MIRSLPKSLLFITLLLGWQGVKAQTCADQAVSATQSSFICEGETTIDLASSEVGVDYYLRNDVDDSIIKGPVAGTGSGISLGTGTITNTTTFNVYAQSSTPTDGLNFDGIDDRATGTDIGFPAGAAPRTVEGWINVSSPPTGGDGNELIIQYGSNASSQIFGIGLHPSGRTFFWGFGNDILGPTNIVDGIWHHIALSYDGTTARLYLDGQLEGSKTTTLNTVLDGDFQIGEGHGNFLDGAVDNIAIWNFAKTQAEIQNDLNKCFVGTETGLVAYWDLNDGVGSSVATDKTGNGYDATLTNMNPASDWIVGTACVDCDFVMTNKPTVTIESIVDQAAVAAETSFYCEGETTIDLASSQTGLSYYLRNDADNNIIDGPVSGTGSSISLNTGNITATTTYNVYSSGSTSSAALDFKGGDDHVLIPGAGALLEGDNTWTIEFWIQDPDNNSYPFSINTSDYIYIHPAGTIIFYSSGGNFQSQNSTWPSDGQPHHLAFRSNGTTGQIFVDGVPVAMQSTNSPTFSGIASEDFSIGSDLGFTTQAIDGFRIWNVARSDAEISANYNQCLAGSETGLQIFYTFDEGTGATAVTNYGSVGSSFDGVLTNMDPANDWVNGLSACATASCATEMTNKPTVTINSISDQSVSAAETSFYCEGETTIDLASSQTGLNYYLKNDADNSTVEGPVAGTGSGISLGTGVVTNTTTFKVIAEESEVTDGLAFDGVDDRVVGNDAGLPSGSAARTVEGWIKVSAAPNGNELILEYGSSVAGQKFGLGIHPSGRTYFWGFSADILGPTNIVDGEWHHLSVTYDGSAASLYLDGELEGSQSFALNTVLGGTFQLGEGEGAFLEGALDNVSVWNFAKTQAQIQNDLNKCFAGTETGLVAYWDLNDGAGSSVATDKTGNGYDATLTDMDPANDWVAGITCVDCELEMTDKPTVTIDPLADQSVTVSESSLCPTNTGTTVNLTSSQTGVNYYLRNDADNSVIDGPFAGGGTIAFNTNSITNTTSYNVLGEVAIGNALAFDGIDDEVRVSSGAAAFANLSVWTIEMWVKVPVGTTAEPVFATKNDASPQFAQIGPSIIQIRDGKGTAINATGYPDDGEWHHVAVVSSSANNGSVYVDGAPVTVTQNSHNGFPSSMSTYDLVFGWDGFSGWAEASIAEFRFWNVARSSADINSNLDSNLSGGESGLLMLYEFEEGSGITTSEATTNYTDGTLTNMDPTTAWIPYEVGCSQEMATTVTVNVSDAPNAGNYTGTPEEVCTTETAFDLTSLLDGNQDASGVWSDSGGSGATISGSMVDFNGVISGSYDFTYTVPGASGCADDSEIVTVNLTEAQNAGNYIGIAAEICATETAFDLSSLLDGSQDAGGSWAQTSGSSTTAVNELTGLVDFTGSVNDTYTFEYTVNTSGPCTEDVESVVVIINDSEAPTPDETSLADLTGECSVAAPIAPTATDNCEGSITGVADVTFPITAQGTTVVTWSFDDGNGNISTQTQNVIIDDVTAPVADAASLADLSDECSVAAPTAPTATDNCEGSITGVADVTFPITAQGTTVVTWSFDDGNGNISTQTQNVILDDVTAPVADAASLADLSGECSVAAPIAPTATDNCEGSITGVADVTFPIIAQGTTVVTWSFDDGNGNISTQTQNVIIDDVTAPVADEASLADFTGECSVAAPTAPTATDNCEGAITGVADVTFPITAQGTTVVTWSFDDGNGNISTQTQNVIIDDVTAPVADAASLADLSGECSVAAPIAPTATDNCEGSITGVADVTFPIIAQGTTVVTWSFDDGNGNISTQTQNVIIDDVTAPVADEASLADFTGECSVAAPTAPTATDNCEGAITGVADVTFPITAQGTTVVTWSFDDGNGNISTQTQNVFIDDVTAPVADAASLADLSGECSVAAPIAPTATDNCEGAITGVADVTFPITAQGTTVVTWSFDDGNGNISTQTQNVVITTLVWYADADGDGFGNAAEILEQCEQPDGYVADGTDCDDSDPNVYPGAPAVADGKDNDCDGEVDKVDQTITFDPIEDQSIDAGSITLNATSTSELVVNFTVLSGPATVEGNVLTFIGTGEVEVEASQEGDSGYNPATPITRSFTISTVTNTLQLKESNILVYPNPASKFITISNETLTIEQVKIVNLKGETMEIIQTEGKVLNLKIDQLSKGVYMLILSTKEGQVTSKFMKK